MSRVCFVFFFTLALLMGMQKEKKAKFHPWIWLAEENVGIMASGVC